MAEDNGELRPADPVHPRAVFLRDGVIHKEGGPWTPAVHAVLRHLEATGFDGSPRVLGSGFDADGLETLSYIEGDTTYPPRLWSLEAALGVGQLLRRLHDALRTVPPSADATWYPLAIRTVGGHGRQICHGDAAPWNLVARDGFPVAIIDFERAGPMDPLHELAYALWLNAELHDEGIAKRQNLPSLADRLRTARAIVDGYGLGPADRRRLFDLMLEVILCDLATSAFDLHVEPNSEGPQWSFAWPARDAVWLLHHRKEIERTLA